jgi:hypothetical protein
MTTIFTPYDILVKGIPDKSIRASILYIDPPASSKSKEPINDDLVTLMKEALANAAKGFLYLGVHTCEDGTDSENFDYFFKVNNHIVYKTNSLAVYYLQYYRECIPTQELELLKSWL